MAELTRRIAQQDTSGLKINLRKGKGVRAKCNFRQAHTYVCEYGVKDYQSTFESHAINGWNVKC